jgi:hypothetical protein
VNSYLVETSTFPVPADPSVTADRLIATNTAEGLRLINTLCGYDRERNSKGIRYLALPESDQNRFVGSHWDGKRIDRLDDARGHPYWIALDLNNDGKLEFQWGKMKMTLRGRSCAVMSAGADGRQGTADDVKTW